MADARRRLGEEARLDRRQGEGVGHLGAGTCGCRRRLCHDGDLRQFGDALLLEQLLGRQANALAARTGDDLQAEDGVAAKGEEVVVTADALDLQHLLPERRQLRLDALMRRLEALLCRLRLRQRLTVELAIGGQREAFEKQHMARQHVIRQALSQLRL